MCAPLPGGSTTGWSRRISWRRWEPDNCLNPPHGMGDTEVTGWLGALPALLASDAFPDELFQRVLAVIRAQVNYIANNIQCCYDNIFMTQHDCLLHASWRLAFLPDAAGWREKSVLGLNNLLDRLFHADGSSVEATGWYHFIVANMLHRHWLLQRSGRNSGCA